MRCYSISDRVSNAFPLLYAAPDQLLGPLLGQLLGPLLGQLPDQLFDQQATAWDAKNFSNCSLYPL